MKCKICNTSFDGSLCPICGNLSPYGNPTKTMSRDDKQARWRKILKYDRMLSKNMTGGIICALLAGVCALFMDAMVFGWAWLMFYGLFMPFRVVRSYAPRNLVTNILAVFAGLAGWACGGVCGALYTYIYEVPYVGSWIVTLINLAILIVPYVLLTQRRNTIKNEMREIIVVQEDWDDFTCELVNEHAEEMNESARRGKGFEARDRYVRPDFLEQVMTRYQSNLSKTTTKENEE